MCTVISTTSTQLTERKDRPNGLLVTAHCSRKQNAIECDARSLRDEIQVYRVCIGTCNLADFGFLHRPTTEIRSQPCSTAR